MFTGVTKNNSNSRAVTFLENSVLGKKLNRIILFGDNPQQLTRLSQDYLTALNVQGFKTQYFHIDGVKNEDHITYSENPDIVVCDGLFSTLKYEDSEKEEIRSFLNAFQHSYIFITCPLTPDEVFSDYVRNYFDNDIIWSRNFLGCKQLFTKGSDRLHYLKHLHHHINGDYRFIQSIEFLSAEVTPYFELEFLNKEKIKNILEHGNDSQNNTLLITTKAELKLVNFHNLNDYDVAVRLETFGAGNGYVGNQLSNNSNDEYYRLLLEGYYSFLLNKREVYMDYSLNLGMTNEALVIAIKEKM